MERLNRWLAELDVRRRRRPLAIVLAVAVVARLIYAVIGRTWVFAEAYDHWEYGFEMGRIAASLAQGHGFSYPLDPYRPTAWMAPLYPFFMGGVFRVFGVYSEHSALVLELVQAVFSMATCLLVYALGRRLYSGTAGLIAAGLLAVYPPSVYWAVGRIWATSVLGFCLAFILLEILRTSDDLRWGRGARLGILLGATALLDPIVLGLLPVAGVWFLYRGGRDRARAWRAVGAMAICSTLLLTPWLVRNYLVYDQIVFIKSNFGHELYLGNNPDANPDVLSETLTGIERLARHLESPVDTADLSAAEKAYLTRVDEADQNRFYLREGLAHIARDPLRFLGLSAQRFLLFWTFMRSVPGMQALLSNAVYLVCLTLALYGFLASRRTAERGLIFLTLLWLPTPHYFTVVGLFRYRFPVEPILIVFAAQGVYRIMTNCAKYGE